MLYEQIQETCANIDVGSLEEDAKKKYQLDLVKTQSLLKQLLGETAKERQPLNESAVAGYILQILNNGFNLQVTKPSANSGMVDAQNVKGYKTLIKSCVQSSPFSGQAFKIKGLHRQRNNIEQAKTIHELRQAVNDMIPALEVIRELTKEPEPFHMDLAFLETESLLKENEQLREANKEKDRVLSEILDIYNDDSISMPRKVKQTIETHNCSEFQACKILGISRSTLNRAKDNTKA